MHDQHWSHAERVAGRRALGTAYKREEAALLKEFKEKMAAAASTDDLWAIGLALKDVRYGMQRRYEIRFSWLVIGLGNLMREGWLREDDLVGLAKEKVDQIRAIAAVEY